MTIAVSVLEFPEGASLHESSMTFDEQGGTLGRTQNNTWVLDDPERFLSGSHCKVIFESDGYFLVDTSTNGTFVNNSDEPLGKGNKVKLNDGDQFELSDYKFKVQLLSNNRKNGDLGLLNNQVNILDSDDPFAAPSVPVQSISNPLPVAPVSSDPFASSISSNDLPVDTTTEETDPLAALNKSNQILGETISHDEPFSDSYSDNANVSNQSVAWPDRAPQKGIIPENWDDDLSASEPAVTESPKSGPVKPLPTAPLAVESAPIEQAAPTISVSESEAKGRALEKENKKIRAELAKLKKQMKVLKKRSTSGIDTTLVDAIGFKNKNLKSEKIAEINEISGEFIRHVVEGMMQTLASRNNVKNTFRMNMTTIQPVENNPLKFSANVDDALDNMFLKEGNSYKKPVETVQESFESIADHQVAILAGIRSAFKSIVNRFEPVTLETRFNKQNTRGLLPRNEKAKYWDNFHEYYIELFSDIDSSFQYLFGDEFSQAYEEQLQLLSHARKK